MTNNFLHNYFLNNNGKILHKWIHYFDIYEKYFIDLLKNPSILY